MSSLTTKGDGQRMNDLISTIKIIKLRLEAKYGPDIKKKWAKRDRNVN